MIIYSYLYERKVRTLYSSNSFPGMVCSLFKQNNFLPTSEEIKDLYVPTFAHKHISSTRRIAINWVEIAYSSLYSNNY